MQVRPYRIGVPMRLDSEVLAYGMGDGEGAELHRAAPGELSHRLCTGELDAALVPSIDLQRADRPLMVLPAGCVAAPGRSLAARVFSQRPSEDLDQLTGALTAPTSAILARVLWQLLFRRELAVSWWDAGAETPDDGEGVVVEGDDVVVHPPVGFERQYDPAGMWHEATGLPFVFAVWAMRAKTPTDCEHLFHLLRSACRRGREHTAALAERAGPAHGWPADLARRYLVSELQFEFTDACRDGLEEFFFLAAGLDAIDRYHPVSYYEP